ncbi:25321_t:CDS:1, partial [Gigaspora margarita]
ELLIRASNLIFQYRKFSIKFGIDNQKDLILLKNALINSQDFNKTSIFAKQNNKPKLQIVQYQDNQLISSQSSTEQNLTNKPTSKIVQYQAININLTSNKNNN